MLCYVMLCYVMLCYVMLCYVMLCANLSLNLQFKMKQDQQLLSTNRSETPQISRYHPNMQIHQGFSVKNTLYTNLKDNYECEQLNHKNKNPSKTKNNKQDKSQDKYQTNSKEKFKSVQTYQNDSTLDNSKAFYSKFNNKSFEEQNQREQLFTTKKIVNNNYSNPNLHKKQPCLKHFLYDPVQNIMSDPDIHELSYKLYPNQSLNQISKDQLKERLIKNMKQKHFERLQMKVQKQKQEIKNYCFQPNPEKQKGVNEKIFDRLFKESFQKQQAYRKNQLAKIQNENIQFKKQQKLNKCKAQKQFLNQESRNLQPLYKRIYEVMEQKRKYKQLLSLQSENKGSHIPQINKNSEKIFLQMEFNKKQVVQRLLQSYENSKIKKQVLKQNTQNQKMQGVTFQPKINDFIFTDKDQNIQIKKQKLLEEQYLQQHNIYSQRLFKPNINDLSSLIIAQTRKKQNFQQKNNRLCYGPVKEKQQKVNQIQNQMYVDCNFKPKINKISKKLCFHKSDSKKYPKHICQNQYQKQEDLPTFNPQINLQSKLMTPLRKSQSLDKIKAKNKKKLMAYEMVTQYQNLRECSFQPQVNDWKKWKQLTKNKKLSQVNGVENFIKNCEKANKKKQNKRQIQQKLFNLQKRYDKRIILQEKSKHHSVLIKI